MSFLSFTLELHNRQDVVLLRIRVEEAMSHLGFCKTDRVKFCTATSEIAQNAVRYGGGGEVDVKIFTQELEICIHLTVKDFGPGIADLPQAMVAGFSTSGTLGLGLSGAKNLVDDFAISSTVGKGTCVTIKKSGKIQK